MTLDANEVTQVLELSARVTAEMIRNLGRGTGGATMPIPVKRYVTVGSRSNVGDQVLVRADGDSDAVPAVNATGQVLQAGDRALCEWWPPAGVYVTNRVTRASRGDWTTTLTGTGANNSGATRTGDYSRDGERVNVRGLWTVGGGAAVPTANIAMGNLPFPVVADGDGLPAVFNGYVLDSSAAVRYPLIWVVDEGQSSGPLYVLLLFGTPGYPAMVLANAGTPITYAAGDSFVVFGNYDTDAA